MPAAAFKQTLPTMVKFLAVPKTTVTSKGYSTLSRTNSFKQQQEKLNKQIQTQQNHNHQQQRAIQIQTKTSAAKMNDRQLHDSFHGLMPRLLSLSNLLHEKGRNTFSELFLNDVIVTEQLFTGIKLYTDLQNPLLQKYAFNVQEFFSGTQEAFLQTQKAITLLHLIQADLLPDRRENYQLVEIHKHLLKAAVSPKLMKEIQMKLLEPVDSHASDCFRDYVIDISSLKLHSIVIENVSTKIIEGEDCIRTNGNIVDDYSQISYPVGSVLATVDVIFESEQLYEHVENPEKPWVRRLVSSQWKFQGCISGHAPLNWMIISMKNHIKNSELIH